ncbi:hypothetical protein [Streptomyces phaeofaciens]|uniref:hypothetical protein n=1 Tax=Streptomyces phaeofaciens TaxID=68254 RepID=UPI00167A97A8|nr:hypothetical protein [Streptomyces phaeofaciens]
MRGRGRGYGRRGCGRGREFGDGTVEQRAVELRGDASGGLGDGHGGSPAYEALLGVQIGGEGPQESRRAEDAGSYE